MSNAERRAAVVTIVTSLILYSLGCGGGDQTNTNQYTPTPTPVPVPSACLEKDPAIRAIQVQDELAEKLGVGNQGNEMKIEVQVAPESKDYLVLLIEGSSRGKVTFGDQMALVREYMVDTCVMKVFFVPKGTVSKFGDYLGDDFEWSTCEWPKQPCPTGTCDC